MKKLLAILALTLMTVLGVAPAALADTPTEVVVEDTAGVLYQPQLLAALKGTNFHQPTKVAVYTRAGEPGEYLNEEVLRFARANHPEWLSADGQKWADGLFIFAVDTVNRKVGSYMGEDRKVSESQEAAIQEASKDDFRRAKWTDGTIAGVKKGAALINQPWYQSAAFIITTSIAGGLALLGFGTWAGIRANNRAKAAAHLKRGDASFANVSMDLDVTELNAKTIPPTSTYGAQVLEKYRNFSTEYGHTAALNQQSHDFSKKDLSKGANVKIVSDYADAAVELDGLDDVIADTNTLLNKFSGWDSAWDRQVQPLREDLDQLPEVIARKDARKLPAAAALSSFHTATQANIELWGAQLGTGDLSPETALDNLKAARDELGTLLTGLSDVLVEQYTKTPKEALTMRSAMFKDRQARRDYGRPNILGTVYGMNVFYTVGTFDHAYASARSSIDSARSSSSSSGSSSGYGSSGGSFSGSGSSSSF